MGKWLNGMRVRENGETYVCTRDIDPLLYPPSQVATLAAVTVAPLTRRVKMQHIMVRVPAVAEAIQTAATAIKA